MASICLLRRPSVSGAFLLIMPFQSDFDPVFDRAILPALARHRFTPIRTDRTVPAGDLLPAICEGVRHCTFAIADTTGDRPNVMYELGMAHAADKRVILLRRGNADGSLPPPPFDFYSHSILQYDADLDVLRSRLEERIAGLLLGRLRRQAGAPDAPQAHPPAQAGPAPATTRASNDPSTANAPGPTPSAPIP